MQRNPLSQDSRRGRHPNSSWPKEEVWDSREGLQEILLDSEPRREINAKSIYTFHSLQRKHVNGHLPLLMGDVLGIFICTLLIYSFCLSVKSYQLDAADNEALKS